MKKPFQTSLVCILLYVLTTAIIASLFVWVPDEHNQFPLLRNFIIFFASVLLTKYFIYMTLAPWNRVVRKLKKKNYLSQAAYQPKVSVIIPAWNEEIGLVHTVTSALTTTYRNLEIVIINDGSTDKSDVLIRQFLSEYYYTQSRSETTGVDILYDYQKNTGKGSALNQGIAMASGEIIVSIDADCALTPETISNFVEHFKDETVMAAVGNVKIGNTQTTLGIIQYLEFLFSFYFKNVDSLFNTIYIIGGAAGAFRREVFAEVGGYSTCNLTEDIDLSVRIQKAGMRIVYASDAVVYTEGASTMKGLMQQRLRWKHGRFQTFSDHRDLFFSTNPKHCRLLSWVVLPFAIFGDMQLFFEVPFLVFLCTYSLVMHDFSSFVTGIIVVGSMFWVQIFEDSSARRPWFFVFAPIAWLLFYLTTLVEYHALFKSLWGLFTRQELGWQRWERTGVFEQKAYAR